MVFSSAVFLFIFLPVVLIAHTIVKNTTARNWLLIVASLVFYAFGEPVYILLLIGSVIFNYIMGRIIYHYHKKWILALSVAANLSLLVIYKYAGFLVASFNDIFGMSIKEPQIVMPIGISFFTFQAISYIVDLYRDEKAKKTSFFEVLLYISLFPQLIAGPIVQYRTVADLIKDRTVTLDKFSKGINRFIVGLSKKMLISNTMGYAADKIFALSVSNIDAPLGWLGAVSYTLQIYFDFSGYSDMAVGIGWMLGFEFPENFNYPYIAVGIRDFWRRWHMSLTSWFREYLYIPLGGNKKGKARQILNSMIVFLCTGIWHGANMTFLVWGLFHGILISIETIFYKKDRKEHMALIPLKWLYTNAAVIIGFVIFRADSLSYGVKYIGQMFTGGIDNGAFTIMKSILTPSFIVTLAISIVASCPVIPFIRTKFKDSKVYTVICTTGYVFTLILFGLCVMTLASNSYNPFIYFRF